MELHLSSLPAACFFRKNRDCFLAIIRAIFPDKYITLRYSEQLHERRGTKPLPFSISHPFRRLPLPIAPRSSPQSLPSLVYIDQVYMSGYLVTHEDLIFKDQLLGTFVRYDGYKERNAFHDHV